MSAPARPDLTLEVAAPDEQAVIANLFQFYIHDFSEFWWDQDRGELEADGRFAPPTLDRWWRGDPGAIPLLLRAGGHPAGFALVDATSHSGLPLERNVAEFFVVRKHRRGGVGTWAARTLFARYPGVWEAAVARRNIGALGFWTRAIEGYPQAEDIEVLDRDDEHWNGPILRFTARPAQ
ncbi:GNAT family N-acetyltransferase [Caulobacter sp. KR2-114]|uniref:GNAT family N-acetyltransferase n=1 Tax=Caulobacter sp. KR2-114 TaxID=3400912 RepID=UPI003C037447